MRHGRSQDSGLQIQRHGKIDRRAHTRRLHPAHVGDCNARGQQRVFGEALETAAAERGADDVDGRAEDHIDPKLLFAGTEFGLYYTKIGGEKWIKFTGGLPTIEVSGHTLYKRLALVARHGRIAKVFYPVFPPDRNAMDVVAWLRANQ